MASAPLPPPGWAPSPEESRGDAALFLQADKDGDGFVEAVDARALCDGSGLPVSTLALAWEHADRDHDGRLTFREFVLLLHLVSCCSSGTGSLALERGPR